MLSPPRKLWNFIDSYAGRKDLLPVLRRAYITCIESDMTDDWDGKQRIGFFRLIEDLQDLIPCLNALLKEFAPLLAQITTKYEAEAEGESKKKVKRRLST